MQAAASSVLCPVPRASTTATRAAAMRALLLLAALLGASVAGASVECELHSFGCFNANRGAPDSLLARQHPHVTTGGASIHQLVPAPTCPLPHCHTADICQTYVVQSGDSLYSISNNFGVQMDDLQAAMQQCVGFTGTLQVGQKICLTGWVPACDHVIDSGG